MEPDAQPTPPLPPEESAPPASEAQGSWPKAVMWTGVTLILVVGAVMMFRSCLAFPERTLQRTGETLDKASETMATVAAAFRRGTITTSFVSYATTLTNSQYLQFATLQQMEIFSRTEAPSTGFGYVPLPDVVVEARAPVEYTYYLDLNGKWDFVLRDGVIEVFAPPIRANKPAVDVSGLTYEVRKGRFRTAEAQENLKSSITSMVAVRAKDNIPLVRETGRRETAEFVERWLARSFADGKSYVAKVYFPGEGPSGKVPIVPRPAQ